MKTICMNYDVKSEFVEDFKQDTTAAIEAMKQFDGHVTTRLFADTDKPNALMIFSVWDSVELFQAFMNSDAFKQAISSSMMMLEGMPSHKVYEETSGL